MFQDVSAALGGKENGESSVWPILQDDSEELRFCSACVLKLQVGFR